MVSVLWYQCNSYYHTDSDAWRESQMPEAWFFFPLLQVEKPALTGLPQAVMNAENTFLFYRIFFRIQRFLEMKLYDIQ